MGQVFLKRGAIYSQTEGNFQVSPMLDDGIYQIQQNPLNGELFLVRIADEFHFGFKLYGIDETLVKHVLDTYNKQPVKKNLGVLLNGAKGTGKTVTAKVMANKLGLPVILCENPYPGLARFLAGIDHDCIFFFDEFEKNFRMTRGDDEDCAGEDLLSIMDGIYNADHCHIFLLTTNKLRVNDNLISRPSRIRYLKSFGDVIDRKILEEFVDDNLIYKEFKAEIMDFVDSLSMVTIDIVKSIVEEVNIHHCSVETFKNFFNVKEATYRYYLRYWSYYKDEKDSMSKEQFIKEAKSPYSDSSKFRLNYGNWNLNKSVKKLKVGDFVNGSYKVTEVDLKNNYVLCEDTTYRGQMCHYFIENIDETPSIYSNGIDYAYDRNDCYDIGWEKINGG